MIARSGLVFGFALWALATALFIPFGHLIFGPDNALPIPVAVTASIVGTLVACYAFARRILTKVRTGRMESAASLGVYLCLPGLILDGSLLSFGGGRYPGLDTAASGVMAYGLLFAYGAALLATLAVGARAGALFGRDGIGGTG